jgi:hypothetical protein
MQSQNQTLKNLQDLNYLSDQMIEKILADKYELAYQYLDQIRLYSCNLDFDFRSDIASQKAKLDETIVERMSVLLKNFNKKIKLIEEWCHRLDDTSNFDVLIKTEFGVNYLIDSFLPISWNFNRDLVFLFSDFAEILAEGLLKRGQKNILILTPKKDKKNSHFAYIKDVEDVRGKILDFEILPKIVVSIEPLDLVTNSKYIKEVYKEIENNINFFYISKATFHHFSTTWVNQKFINLKYTLNSYKLQELEKNFAGNSVVVVAPGPSLGSDIIKLKKSASKYVILAVGQACKILSEHGISPDFVLIIDAQDHIYVFDGLMTSNLKAIIMYDTVHENFFKALPEIKKIAVSPPAHIGQQFIKTGNEITQDISAGSVSVVALKIAISLKASTIGLMGQDLHLSEGNYVGDQTNLTDSVPEGYVRYQSQVVRKLILKSNSGKEVISFRAYWTYLLEIEEALENLPKETKVVNFSKHGVKIRGAEFLPFDMFCETLKNDIEYFDIKGKNRFQLEKDRKIFLDSLKAMNDVQEEFRLLLKKTIKLYKNEGNTEAVNNLELKLQNLYKMYFFMSLYSQRKLQNFEALMLTKVGAKKIRKSDLLKLYSGLLEDVTKLQSVIKKARKGLIGQTVSETI